ncbi:hypothetical protein OSB04_028771 [Centaurea solstitialis]|uniref:Retroviral polymerase SH3-like domain-containing protein n=1 Tax=Centaurea solstitialis TaxID=347529 RepID=A0AA38SGE8_9ASTR|nr:hypothetical protein OSB04_028771 [Centaurea solstitialis]
MKQLWTATNRSSRRRADLAGDEQLWPEKNSAGRRRTTMANEQKNATMVWGCEVFVRRETNNKLEPRAEKCLFVGYPNKSFGYIFYKPSENKVFVARRGVFLERELISKEDGGSNIDLKEIQEITNDEPIVDASPQHEVESPVEETNTTPPPMESGIQSIYDNHV